ncbi:sigma-70 family RNA polymerase sigma factor [Thalassoglobus sp.]|uniref:sigma-70 family RNA polymerase sigma factor n=1 Tax=Thalassoglobus sp. TaxID=2795869 RepID=UPI003AA7DAB1
MTQPTNHALKNIDIDHELTKGFTARFIRQKARRMVGHTSLRKSDQPDLEQDFKLAVWNAVPNFDPTVGDWKSFVATVVERQAAMCLRRRRTLKHQQGNDICSLDVLVTDGEGNDVTLASQIGTDRLSAVTGNYGLDELQFTELRIEVEDLLEQLTDEERKLLSELSELPQAEVADLHGIPRRTLRDLRSRLQMKLNDVE